MNETDVLIVGAVPTGLTLAIDLARRGIAFQIIDKSPAFFPGSRAKGQMPRTLEVFDDLASSMRYWPREGRSRRSEATTGKRCCGIAPSTRWAGTPCWSRRRTCRTHSSG